MFSPLIFWLWFAGLVILVGGLFAARKAIWSAGGLEKLVAMGPAFFAAPLAAFGAEHLLYARSISQIIPAWIPAHMFWTYFVGCALICGGAALALRRYPHLAAALLGFMFVCFVLMLHIPNVAAHPDNRIFWALVFRDLSFGGGALALASIRIPALRIPARVFVAVALLFFAAEHFLHPEFAPGVPLAKVTPDWFPVRAFWGYLMGAALLLSGATMLAGRPRKYTRLAATLLGLLIAVMTLVLYLPIFLTAADPALLEGVNYVFDTLLLSGAVLLVAAVL